MSKSEVSRICAAVDAEVEAFRSRPLTAEPYPICSRWYRPKPPYGATIAMMLEIVGGSNGVVA